MNFYFLLFSYINLNLNNNRLFTRIKYHKRYVYLLQKLYELNVVYTFYFYKNYIYLSLKKNSKYIIYRPLLKKIFLQYYQYKKVFRYDLGSRYVFVSREKNQKSSFLIAKEK